MEALTLRILGMRICTDIVQPPDPQHPFFSY